jgi:uncharacterized protein (DUF697 family)
MLTNIKNAIVNIEPGEVIDKARDHGLEVQSVEDFRKQAPHYGRIEEVMDDYRSSFYRKAMLSGLTTGIGGFMTSVTFAAIDTVSLSLQLYWMAQRFAILNGFDGSDPLQKDKMMNIYFEVLSLNAVTQATMKHQLLKASAMAGTRHASENMVLRTIVRAGKLMGKNISAKNSGRLVPIFGGVVGATVNYSFTKRASNAMKKAFKREYFNTWQNGFDEDE